LPAADPLTYSVDCDIDSAFQEVSGPTQSLLSPVVPLIPPPPSLLPREESLRQPSLDRVESPSVIFPPLLVPGQLGDSSRSTFRTCNVCGGRFKDADHLENHVAAKHAERVHTCGHEGCGTFSNLRSLNRHLRTARIHLTKESLRFRCRCGYSTPRKDHHKRHLNENRCSGDMPFICWCGSSEVDRDRHEFHYVSCKRGKRGRPRHRGELSTKKG